MSNETLSVSITSAPASDSWGFVGVVLVGEQEAYRSIRSYPDPASALTSTQHLLADVLGSLMAGQEWRTAHQEYGHAPLRTELGFGLKGRREEPRDLPVQPAQRSPEPD